jgi:hypothetical protein
MTSWVPSSRTRAALAATFALAVCLFTERAHANGRMPGATALTIGAGDTDRIVVRATYGIVTSRDAGRTWNWICEQAIGVSGETDPPLVVTSDGTFVLASPKGGLLLSRDEGCTWSPGPSLFAETRAVDLASDPAAPSRAVAISSTVQSIDDQGLVTYSNVIGETTNDARSWQALGALPADFAAETVEIAPSDPGRIYVSGTASDNPLTGVVVRSRDGGATWDRFTLTLPDGSGSVFISGIDPRDPDRLWIRVPARGDTFGFFPASLLLSEDGGETFSFVARTDRAMFGFALSPDGTQLAYGGPFDGVYLGPSTGGTFTKVSTLGVRCLKWRPTGLYACASQPGDPFTLGLSPAGDGTFESLYDARTTCPEACTVGGSFAVACEPTWNIVGPGIGAPTTCAVPWTVTDAGVPALDASTGAGGAPSRDGGAGAGTGGTPDVASGGTPSSAGGAPPVFDASVGDTPDAGTAVEKPRASSSDCSCDLARNRPPTWSFMAAIAALLIGARARRRIQQTTIGVGAT